MKNFRRLGDGFDVAPVLAEIDAHPELWDAHGYRTKLDKGPFAETSDIWVRFRDPSHLSDPQKFAGEHFAQWYPAFHSLPSLRPLLGDILASVGQIVRPALVAHLGGILITRIPARGKIAAHHDRGSWHAEFYNWKIYLPFRANEHCINICEDETVVMKPGEAWWFNNLVTHSVENNGDAERITLIVCARIE